jgi:hypothetical protein
MVAKEPESPMTADKLDITPSVTVHNLLEAFPELEEVLIGIAPPFRKLRNPVLRRSVAKVATIKHISAVGRVPLDELIGTLREAVGQAPARHSYDDEDYFLEKPDWFSQDGITASVDESRLEDKDQMTLVAVLKALKNAKEGDIVELVTTFLPAPGIDVLRSKGYSVWTVKAEGDVIRSYVLNNAG